MERPIAQLCSVVSIDEDSATELPRRSQLLVASLRLVSPEVAVSGFFEQGYAIEEPSEIVVRLGLSKDVISEVRVAGERKPRRNTARGEASESKRRIGWWVTASLDSLSPMYFK